MLVNSRRPRSRLEGFTVSNTTLEPPEPLKAPLVDAGGAFSCRCGSRARARGKVGDAVKLYVAFLEKRVEENSMREPTRKSYAYTMEKVFAPLDEKIMTDIQTADIEEILSDKGNTSRRMHIRNLRVFWKWASSKPREWVAMDTVKDLETVHGSSDEDISVLAVDEVKALLHAAEAERPEAAAAYAIAIFAGVRRSTKDGELTKLIWSDIKEDSIDIGKRIAKKHQRRTIPICPTLRAWLDATRGEAKDEDSITPPNWEDVDKSVRRRAGWDVSARLLQKQVDDGTLKKLPTVTRGKWPTNVCRHTCASIQVAIGTPLDDLTFKFGHSEGHNLLRSHYVGRLTKKDALAILSIGPKGSKISGLKVA
jgi:integrase